MIELNKKHWLLIFAVILIASLVINLSVTLTTPIVFGDEGLYASRGLWIWEHKEIPNFYHIQSQSEAFKTYFIRPPYMMTLLAPIFGIGGEFLVKALLPFVNIITAIVLFLFVKRLHSLEAGVLASVFLIVIPSFITYTILLYVEIVSVFLVTASLYFLYIGLTDNRRRFLVLSAMCSGVAALTDVGAFLTPIIYLFTVFLFRSTFRSFIKRFVFVLVIFLIIVGPWYFLHNYLQANTFGIPVIDRFTKGSSTVILKQLPENLGIDNSAFLSPTDVGGGTSNTILKLGISNYIDFAYTPLVILMAFIGFFYMAQERKKKWAFVVIWLVILLSVNYYLTTTSRAEDASRALLGISIPIALLAGLSSGKIYSGLNSVHKAGKIIAIAFVLILVVWSIYTTNAKAQSLKPIKQFSNSFFQACDWVKENTEGGSLLVTLWQHRAEYACRRDTVWVSDPGIGSAVLARDNRTTQIFKLHGADYIFIQKFSIRPGNEGESYPQDFVNYITSSLDYKLVYETDQSCLTQNNIADCSLVYKIL